MALYTDKDVSAILRRAAEMQARTEGTASTGLTLEELQGIAREVGIDPRYVEQAARQAGQVQVKDDTRYFWGGPGRVQAERVVPGELTDEAWEMAVSEVRRVIGQTGETGQVGRAREWRYSVLGSSMAFLSAAPRKGQTVLHVERRMDNEAVLTFLLPLMLAFTGGLLASIGLGLVGLAVSVPLFILTFFGCRAFYGRMTRKARRKLDDMLDRIELATADAVSLPAVNAPVQAPLLSLPEDPLPGTETSGPDRTRTK